ncbi:MAG: response regulator transcription factor [Candidatus Omnitrophica bacterium]|nr:response regulator transcription factor [Candidatus Omnitrophota bacterium]
MRILLIEDEKKVAGFIKRGLKEENYAVDTAEDGEAGHFLATTNEYDLIVLDVMLPKMDGLTLCARLRREGHKAPILMLTARDSLADKVKGLDAGANDYLTKPFAFEEFLARVRALLRTRVQDETTKLRVADLTVDLVRHQVSRGGKDIELTPKEFALLEYMARHAGAVITRTMISEHVWDIHFDSLTNVIDVYVNYLRKKIDGGFSVKLIHTVRGRGYRFGEK